MEGTIKNNSKLINPKVPNMTKPSHWLTPQMGQKLQGPQKRRTVFTKLLLPTPLHFLLTTEPFHKAASLHQTADRLRDNDLNLPHVKRGQIETSQSRPFNPRDSDPFVPETFYADIYPLYNTQNVSFRAFCFQLFRERRSKAAMVRVCHFLCP